MVGVPRDGRDRRFDAVLVAALALLSSCAQPPARLPVRADCAESDICNGRGWVVVEVDVAASGRVETVEIVEACPDDRFNRTALREVATWDWKPASEGVQDVQLRLCRP